MSMAEYYITSFRVDGNDLSSFVWLYSFVDSRPKGYAKFNIVFAEFAEFLTPPLSSDKEKLNLPHLTGGWNNHTIHIIKQLVS